MLPETWVQVAVTIAAVIPGFVYQVSRRGVAGPGPDERDVSVRVLRSIASSAVFAGLYAIVWGEAIAPYLDATSKVADDIQAVGAFMTTLVVVIPWMAARVGFYVTTSTWFEKAAIKVRSALHLQRSWDPTPSAWDYAFRGVGPCWVRVRTEDGLWVGGWYAEDSFASSWPDPEELYIEKGYAMNEDGTFTSEVSAPNGVYVKCGKAVLVDFIANAPDTGDGGDE